MDSEGKKGGCLIWSCISMKTLVFRSLLLYPLLVHPSLLHPGTRGVFLWVVLCSMVALAWPSRTDTDSALLISVLGSDLAMWESFILAKVDLVC